MSEERLTSVCESSKTSSVVVEDVVAGIAKQKELVKDVMGEDGTRDVGSEKIQRKTCRRPKSKLRVTWTSVLICEPLRHEHKIRGCVFVKRDAKKGR